MLTLPENPPEESARQNLKSLFVLRNIIMGGIAMVIVLTVFGLGIPLRHDPLWAVLALQSVVNSLTAFRLQHVYPVTDKELFGHLLFDVLTTTALLYFTGGAGNPMSWIFLIPLILTATILPQIYTWYMVLVTVACYTLLIAYNIPLPKVPVAITRPDLLGEPAHELILRQSLQLHTFGMWLGFVMAAALVAYFVVEMADNLRERDRRLAEAREQALQNERIVALGTLAAGAAHEMGTPLNTMALLIDELEHEHLPATEMQRQVAILRSQIQRCKKALGVLSASAGEIRAEGGSRMPVDAYLHDLIGHWQSQRPNVALQTTLDGPSPSPCIVAEQTLSYALINILDNAAEASAGQPVGFHARWDFAQLHIRVVDHGPGIQPHIRAQLGKAPFSTKQDGLGVGLFLAFQTVHRLGGKIELLPEPAGGTLTRIELPLLPQGACP